MFFLNVKPIKQRRKTEKTTIKRTATLRVTRAIMEMTVTTVTPTTSTRSRLKLRLTSRKELRLKTLLTRKQPPKQPLSHQIKSQKRPSRTATITQVTTPTRMQARRSDCLTSRSKNMQRSMIQ